MYIYVYVCAYVCTYVCKHVYELCIRSYTAVLYKPNSRSNPGVLANRETTCKQPMRLISKCLSNDLNANEQNVRFSKQIKYNKYSKWSSHDHSLPKHCSRKCLQFHKGL